jgi:GT2 family glycosyltransferase
MRILIITVNHNNSLLTLKLLENISCVFPSFEFYIVDNDSDENNKSTLMGVKNATVIFSNENVGYFQGINIVLNKIDRKKFKYIIICNNDIIFNNDFYNKLENIRINKDIFVISPRILDMDGRDQNPMIDHKTSRIKIFFYDIYYINYYIGQLLYKIWQWLKRLKRIEVKNVSRQIHIGYGAIYILTKNFFSKNKKLDHPPFLMGEESFLANQTYRTGGKIYYNVNLLVYHRDHSSCSKIPLKKKYYITKESYKIYRKILLDLPRV